MIIKRARESICSGVLLASLPLTAHADAIIPYMVVPWGQVFLLPFVILIEALVLKRILKGTFRSSFVQSFVANIVSTILGAILYFVTPSIFGERLFHWWFKGGFSSEAVRNACIALLFAILLWLISWISESALLARLRKTNSIRELLYASAFANLITYTLLLVIAIWFGSGSSGDDVSNKVDAARNSQNIESLIRLDPEFPLVGFWKWQCEDDFGSAIEAASQGKYTIAFCGPGGCDRVDSLPHVAIVGNPSYRIIDQDTIEKLPSGGTIHRCKIQK